VAVVVSDDVETRGDERRAAADGLQLVVMAESGTHSVQLPPVGAITIGRGQTADVRIDDPSISRSHAVIHVGGTLQLEDLDSANGTFLHGQQLAAGKRIDVMPGEFFEIGSLVCVIRGRVTRERPPQLRSHEHFEARLQDEVSRARRSGAHPVVIRVRLEDDDEVAVDVLLGSVQPGDVVARYAPGEYEVMLPDATTAAAGALVDLMRVRLAAVACIAEPAYAVYPRDGSSAEELFAAACRTLEPAGKDSDGEIVVAAPAMRKLHDLLGRVARAGVNVLLLGETGVGKEVFATRLHERSPRAGAPLVKLNCAALTMQLFESELFGHERGAFTGADRRKQGLLETAHGGVVFLDEIGELDLGLQAKLLRVIEDRRVRRLGGVV
jgi:predicted ATP-dependent protease